MKRATIVLVPLALLSWLLTAAVLDQRHARLSAALVQAVNSHNAWSTERVLTRGADPDSRDWKTYYLGEGTPFRPPWYEKPLTALMRRKPRAADSYVGPTVLMIAAFHGDTRIVRSLLDHEADMTKTGTGLESKVNISWVHGTASPVFEAVLSRNVPTALLLIQRGSRKALDLRSYWGQTALMQASQIEIVASLINHGADVNARDDNGWTPLMSAAQNRDLTSDVRIISALLDRGAEVNAVNERGETPLTLACLDHMNFNSKGRGQQAAAVKLLLARGAAVNFCTTSDGPPLLLAAEDRNLETVRALLSQGANVNSQNGEGETALMLVSYDWSWKLDPHWKAERRAMQKLLLGYGADPNVKNKQGKTAAQCQDEDDPYAPSS